MTPNEFRIGSLVKYDGRIFKLHSIGEYPILDTIEFGAKVVEWKDLEPVEITEEVLIGMGLIKFSQYLFYINSLAIDIQDASVRFWGNRAGQNLPMKYPHAHQLQNLIFALTGEEVTLNPELL